MAVRITRAGVGLTVGIIILALVVLGGLYLVRERGEQARRDEAIEIAQQNLEAESEGGALNPSDDTRTDKPENQENANQNGNAQSGSQEGASQGGAASQSTPEQLPATGTDGVASVLIIALLSFTAASYIASRRALSQSL